LTLIKAMGLWSSSQKKYTSFCILTYTATNRVAPVVDDQPRL
jgi:hypothetical protein